MTKKPKAGKSKAVPAPESPAELLRRVEALLDSHKINEALPLLRAALEREPRNLQALHGVNYCLGPRPDPCEADEQRRARDLVLELTEGTSPGPELTLPRRARALALYHRAILRLEAVASPADLDAAVADGKAAVTFRDHPDFHEVERFAEPLRWILDGHYGKLVARVREFPGTRSRFKPLQPHPDFVGYGPALDNPGYLTWLLSRPREPRDPRLDDSFLMAAGRENHARRNGFFEDNERQGRVGRLMTLLHLGADLHATADDGCGALHYVAGLGDVAAIEALAKAGLSVQLKDKDGRTALAATCEPRRAAAARALIALGADPDARGRHSRTPLFEVRDVDVAAALLDGGADVNAADDDGCTPLHLKARVNDDEVVRLLMERGADPLRKRRDGKTALDEALERGHAAAAKLLGGARKKGSIDIDPLLQALREHPEATTSLAFFEDKDVRRVESLLSTASMRGPGSWDEVAALCKLERPWVVFAIVDLASRVLKPDPKPPSFKAEPTFVLGNLSIHGDLCLTGPLLVTGNLVVSGVIDDAGPDSLLAVRGDVAARALHTDGEVVVGGNLDVEELIYGHHNDHSLRVAGDTSARALIADEHDVQIRGQARVEHHFPSEEFDPSDAGLRKIFVAEAFDKSGLSRSKLWKRVSAGRPVFLKARP